MTAMQDVELIESNKAVVGYGDVDADEFHEAAQRLAALMRELLPPPEVAEAMERLNRGYGTDIRDLDQQRFDVLTVHRHVRPTLLKLLKST